MDLLQGWAGKVLGSFFFCKFTDLAAGAIKKNSVTIFSIHTSGKFTNIYRLSLASNHLKKKKERKNSNSGFVSIQKEEDVFFFSFVCLFLYFTLVSKPYHAVRLTDVELHFSLQEHDCHVRCILL